jgi:CO/xanthine dehydrogenase Mo-binding subunit
MTHSGTAQPGSVFRGMLDARERVTGEVEFSIDVKVPGMLHAALLRSTAAHARIARLDVSGARSAPGVHAVLTGEEIAARGGVKPRFGPVLRDQPILALGKVRFAGEPVVAVAADTRDAAAAALDLVEVEYEELPGVFSLDDALAAGAALVHEEPPAAGPTFADVILHSGEGTNLCNSFRLRAATSSRALRRRPTCSSTCSRALPCSTCRSSRTAASRTCDRDGSSSTRGRRSRTWCAASWRRSSAYRPRRCG